MRRFTLYIFVFSPNTGKYGPDKTYHAVCLFKILKKLIKFDICELIYLDETVAWMAATEEARVCDKSQSVIFCKWLF